MSLSVGAVLAGAMHFLKCVLLVVCFPWLFTMELSGGSFLSNYGVPNLTVTDGYFTVQLDFGIGAFTGEARWLEILVSEDSQANYTTLSPRVPLIAVPYAHSLRPGAEVESTTGRAL